MRVSCGLCPVAPGSHLRALGAFTGSFSTLPRAAAYGHCTFRVRGLPFGQKLPLRDQRRVFYGVRYYLRRQFSLAFHRFPCFSAPRGM